MSSPSESDPIVSLQTKIRVCSFSPELYKILERPAPHDYDAMGLRAAQCLAVLCGLSRNAGREVYDLIVHEWETSPSFLTQQEVKNRVIARRGGTVV